jgi:hypothetical protein
MNEEEVRKIIQDELSAFLGTNNYNFQKNIKIFNGRNVQLGKTNGTKFGTETTQKIGFLNATPVSRQSAITAPSGGATVDAEARTAINSIRTVLSTFGFTA